MQPTSRGRHGRSVMRVALAAAAIAAVVPMVATTAASVPDAAAAPADPPGSGMRGYHIYDLSGGAPGLTSMTATGISDDGVVAGNVVESDLSTSPFVWQPGEPWQRLDEAGLTDVKTAAISPSGVIVGTTHDPHGVEAGDVVEWGKQPGKDHYGAMTRLGVPSTSVTVSSVNSAGQVLLDGRNAVIEPDGTITELQRTGPAGTYVYDATTWDINEDGHVAGTLGYDPDGDVDVEHDERHPTIWDDSRPTELPLPDGHSAFAQAINDDDHVAVGNCSNCAAWLWRDGAYVDMGEFHPLDMNDSDQVVGWSTGAVLWDGVEVVELNDLLEPGTGWRLDVATAINEQGQIVGNGLHDGHEVAFLLDPIVPVVFVPGAAASELVVGDHDPSEPAGTEIWLGCTKDRMMLSLDPDDEHPVDVHASDALRYMQCGPLSGHVIPDLDAYGTFLSRLSSEGGYREYRVDGHVERRTTAGCDLSQRSERPGLFVFAYDWRRDNAESAAQLADYIGCVRRFYPSGKINVVTHSMGSLVARRYVLDHPEQSDGIGRMITIGAPWLGAPKLVNALETGEFAPWPVIRDTATIKHILPWFPATHQLMSAAYYHQVTGDSVFREDGWDINGNGASSEAYGYAEMAALLDSQTPGRHPAATAAEFQGHSTTAGGQADWSADATGIEYFHIVGVQTGATTIGRITAASTPVCRVAGSWFCTTEQHFEKGFVTGDGTVPLVSAARTGNGLDLNAPGATVLTVTADDASQDHGAEHTGLTANSSVISTVIGLLDGGLIDDGESQRGFAGGSESGSHSVGIESTPAGAPISTDLAIGTAAALDAATTAAAVPMRYVSLLDTDDIAVADDAGATTAPIEGTDVSLSVPGVTQTVGGDHAGQIVMPLSPTGVYTVSFITTADPLRIDLTEGLQDRPTKAVRWIDADLPAGMAASLTVSADGTNVLRVDDDGDGAPDTVVAPSTTLSGADAADVETPQVTVTANDAGGPIRYAVSAADAGSGVAAVLWSTDGTTFAPYTGPLALDSAVTPILYAFAQDRAGNRSAITTFALASAVLAPLTTATLSPQPSAAGWNAGPVSVALDAVASGGGAIDRLTYEAIGADPVASTTVAGSSAALTIDAAGRTTITFSATMTDGTTEPARTVSVGVDLAAPTVTFQNPIDNGAVESLSTIAGAAGDDAAGVADVEVQVTNDHGRSWNGITWSEQAAWLHAAGTTSWSLATGLPAGDDLPQGAYTLRATVTDDAGRVTTTAPIAVTVAEVAGRQAHLLPSPLDTSTYTSATAINDRGVALGAVGGVAGDALPVSWTRGRGTVLPLPEGIVGGAVNAVNERGAAVGTGDAPSRSVAVIWQPDGTPRVLTPLADAQLGEALDIDDAGAVVGHSGERPVRWDGDAVTELPPLVPGAAGRAEGINDAGVVVGWSNLADDTSRAVIWADGRVRNLGTLGGDTSYAYAINDRGDVVGAAQDASRKLHAFLYRDGEMRDISAGLAAQSSTASGINDAGVVIGSFTDRSGRSFGFVWTEQTGAVELNSLLSLRSGWVLKSAGDVNELGQIVGSGTYDDQPRAFVLGTDHAPFAIDQAITAEAGQPVEITLDGWDPDVVAPLVASIAVAPGHGTLSPVDADTVTYTAAAGFRGEDSFSFQMDDGQYRSALGRVTVTVTGDDDGDGDGTPPPSTPEATQPSTPETTPPSTPETTPPTPTPTTPAQPGTTAVATATQVPAPVQPDIPSGGLPVTGTDTSGALLVALSLVALGAGLVVLRRTRRAR